MLEARKTDPYIAGVSGLMPGEERYVAKAQGIVGFNIYAEDKIQITNIEGMQIAEIVVFNNNGLSDPSIIKQKPSGNAENLKNIIKLDNNNNNIIKKLKKKKFDLNNAKSFTCFTKSSSPNEKINFVSQDDGFILVAAPGQNMSVDKNDAPSDLDIRVFRKNINKKSNELELPDPLSDVKEEYFINHSTAFAYEVKAGDFIQIIDIFGRQCSDFMAFDSDKLQNNKELAIDSTATRAIIGGSYPMPGLFSKYFNRDLEALVEVIQDTCGRHDTFGTACTSKVYEDLGYFGHPNCSDNYNKQLDKYGVQARKGWQAINLFFNTSIDSNNVLFSDLSWSRPGDYVLFQAQKDLVCVSSACPDDTSPANGWNPTDIYVRTYSENKILSKSIAFRKNAEAKPFMTKNTGFHERTSALTRNMMDSAGYWIPTKYNNYGLNEEYNACRNNVVMMDLSSLRKFEIVGPDSEELMNIALTRNVKKLSIGEVAYSAICYESGMMIDDGTIYKLGDNNFRWICGNDYSGEWLRELAKKLKLSVWIKSSTDQLNNLSVQGPNSRKLLKEIIWTPPAQPKVDELEWFHFSVSRLFDAQGTPIMISRTGYTGELGYEIFCHPSDGVKIWDAIWEEGKKYKIVPMGFEALDMLRIEAGLILGGNEFSDQTDPFEAGIGFTVPLKTKNVDFIGKKTLIERKDHPQKKLVGLEIDGNEKANHGDCVHSGRAQVGVITSGTLSPTLNKNIALCRIDSKYSEINTLVEIGKLDGHQKRIAAKIVKFPFYDPDKTRVKS
tara:strand:+ start:2756 stop:5095 length:2340 start_codon:yes stop_codon:yes gene_type:complete